MIRHLRELLVGAKQWEDRLNSPRSCSLKDQAEFDHCPGRDRTGESSKRSRCLPVMQEGLILSQSH